MQILHHQNQSFTVLEPTEIIQTPQDALDFMATADYTYQSHALIVPKNNLPDTFFDLKTRLAGDILQKFSNYNMRLVIVGDFSMYASKALRDFIYECNTGSLVHWASSIKEALNWLASR